MTISDAMRVAKGSTYLVTQMFIATGVRVVAFAFIARILTQTEMGITVALTLTSTVAQAFSDLGFGRALAKYIAEYRGKKADYSLFLSAGLTMKLVTAIFLALVFALAAPQISQLLLKSGDYAFLFRLLSIYVLFFCFNITTKNLLLGLNRIREIAIIDMMLTLTEQISAVALLMLGYGLTGLITGWIFGQLVYMTMSVSIIVRGKHYRRHSIGEIIPFLNILAKISWPLFCTNMVILIYNWFDRALLLAYIPLSEVAVYTIALRTFSQIYIIPEALSTTLLPYYSEQYGENKLDNIIVGVRTATRYIALLYLPLALGMMVTANPAISLFAGSAYSGGDLTLAVLCLFGAIGGLSAAVGTLLLVYEMTPTSLLINLVSVGVSMAASTVLLPFLEVTGMAIVKGVAMIVSLALMIFALRRRVPIELDKEALWKSWTAATFMFLVVGVIEWIYLNQYLLPFYMFAGGVAYVTALKMLKAVNKSDIQLIRNLMGKRLSPIVNVLEKILI